MSESPQDGEGLSKPVAGATDDPTPVELPDGPAVSAQTSEGSSWYSWIRAAKEKTLSTYELVKNDLSEFGDAITQEANTIVSATSSTVKEKVPQLNQVVDLGGGIVKGLLTTVSSVLQGDDTTEGEEESEVPIRVGGTYEARLYYVQTDPSTYCNEPEGAPELFEDWIDHFRLEDRTEEIASLLRDSEEVNVIYSQLVPSKVSHAVFWQRYFYRVHQLRLEEERRNALLARSSSLEQPWDDLLADNEDDGQFVNKDSTAAVISSSPKPSAIILDERTPSPTSLTTPQSVCPDGQQTCATTTEMHSSQCTDTTLGSMDVSIDAVVVNPAELEAETNSEGGSKLSDDWASTISTPPTERSDNDNSNGTGPVSAAKPGAEHPSKAKSAVQSDGEEWIEWEG